MCNKVGDVYEYSEEKAAKCLLDNPNFCPHQVIAAEKYMALVACGKKNWKRYHHLFTNNGRYTTFAGFKRKIVIDGVTVRFEYHHLCQETQLGSDRKGVNLIPLLCFDHADIHIQVSLFISDREVQNAAQMMINLSTLKLSDFLSEDSYEIRRAMYNETNSARYEAQSERMMGNNFAAGPHVYPSGRKLVSGGNNGHTFEIGNTHSVVHEDSAVRAEFNEYDCASHQWWKTWSGMKSGDLIETSNHRTFEKSGANEIRAMRYVASLGRGAAKKRADRAADKVKKEAAAKRWNSFYKK